MTTIRIILAAFVCALLLGGCNTIAGMGKDIEKAGESIQGASQKGRK